MKFVPDSTMPFTIIPTTWDLNSGFNPLNVRLENKGHGLHLKEESLCLQPIEVINGDLKFDVDSLPLRDPKHFMSDHIHSFVSEWESIID